MVTGGRETYTSGAATLDIWPDVVACTDTIDVTVRDGNVGNGTNTAADLDRDGDVDLTDARLLAQRVGNE